MNLEAVLPQILPDAIRWVEEQARIVAGAGAPLNAVGIEIAQRVGVKEPERIRLLEVENFPLPDDGPLRDVANATGLLGPEMDGITFGHSVLIRRGRGCVQLYSHEFRHVHQYEQLGSINAFLSTYLKQIAEVGYQEAPLEVDARACEIE